MTSISFERRGAGGPLKPPVNREQAARDRLLRGNSGIDVTGQTQAAGVNGYQDEIPQADLWPTGPSRVVNEVLQSYWAFTRNSARGGLNMRRGPIASAHARSAASTASSYFRDELSLNFDTTLQQTVPMQHNTFRPAVLWANFRGRAVMVQQGYVSGGNLVFYVETSITDPTIKQVTYGGFTSGVSAMAVIKYNAGDYLCVAAFLGGSPYWVLIANIDSPASGVVLIPVESTFAHLGFPLLTGAYNIGAFIQAGTEGNPLIVKSGATFVLQPTIANSVDWPGKTWEPGSVTQEGWVGGVNMPLGFVAISGRKPKAWFLTWPGALYYYLELGGVEANGLNYEEPNLGISPVQGAKALPERGAIALYSHQRVVIWDGREKETGIFADEEVLTGQRLQVMGLSGDNGDLFASIAELPAPETPSPNASQSGIGRIRIQKRRYDFELQRWHPVSDWLTLTASGVIRWDLSGIPTPDVKTGNTDYGFLPLWGNPDLPLSEFNRQMIDYIQSATVGGVGATPVATWTRKFQPTPGINPLSYNGLDKTWAAEAVDDSPGLRLTQAGAYADKYIDAVEWMGDDIGGTDWVLDIYIAEYGHLDDVDDDGDLTSLHFQFKGGLSHADRRIPSPNNNTSFVIPQIRTKLTRGSQTNLTIQALPFTVYFHTESAVAELAEANDTGRGML